MITGKTIISYIEKLAGHSLYQDEGPQFGDITKQISGITVCWMACPQAITSTAEKKHNFIICHESLTYPYPTFTEEKERQYLSWPTNTQRLSLLGKNDICLCRIHFSLDELFIYDNFIKQIELKEIQAAGTKSVFEKIYKIAPMSYFELVKKIKTAVGMNNLRATRGSPDRIVETIGVAWGGLGLFVNVGYMQSLINLGPIDVMICGETDNYGMRFCKEIGIEVIETSHEISENEGLRVFADNVAKTFADIDVSFFENKNPWTVY